MKSWICFLCIVVSLGAAEDLHLLSWCFSSLTKLKTCLQNMSENPTEDEHSPMPAHKRELCNPNSTKDSTFLISCSILLLDQRQLTRMMVENIQTAETICKGMNVSLVSSSWVSATLSSVSSAMSLIDLSPDRSGVSLTSPFLLSLIGGSSAALLLLCIGFVLLCNINRRKQSKILTYAQSKQSKILTYAQNETKTASIKDEITTTAPGPTKLKRSPTEKEFQETRLGRNEKHRENYLDREKTSIEKSFESKSYDNESTFQNLYNQSFRTFGQKKRTKQKRLAPQPDENRYRYYQQTLATDDTDIVHL
eukprot:GFUD01035285.1.p1 GENE.GFUD01035285.1~~GFUD01035285.1.p1  ORF type:complete len:308 (-),score=78.90 GFUD01035285.1:145-1068(-)